MYQAPKSFFFANGQATKAVVMFHGYAGSTNDMRMLGRYLQRHGYAVYCANFAGHATGEPRDILTKSIDDWLQDARDAVSYVRDRGYKDIAVCGLSLGGLIATWMLAECRDIKTGIAISAPYIMRVSEHFYDQFIYYANLTYQAQVVDTATIAINDRALRQAVPKQVAEITHLSEMVNKRTRDIHQRIMIAQGEADDMLNLGSAATFASQLPIEPIINYYANAGHVLTVNEAHHALEADILHFLDDNL
ncbi:alpha/beta fold hydrolase [Periweissella fabaria]|uniref:Carboxylesterase n=1 Tax=Periweissella fabaria TaxID=546157 RepID=A0ABN8BKV0_9LACO|nr:alpha/beta fold hydrolase [Periweissella fabaria]MCM0597850.1 alpha/beta fold hydrolase [Periweissella fabaria]CAH0417299.1 Carboxylesterase [Periweissella fabaria]